MLLVQTFKKKLAHNIRPTVDLLSSNGILTAGSILASNCPEKTVHPKRYIHSLQFVGVNDQFYPYLSGLLHWHWGNLMIAPHWGNHMIAPVSVKKSWLKYVNNLHESAKKFWYSHDKRWAYFMECTVSLMCCRIKAVFVGPFTYWRFRLAASVRLPCEDAATFVWIKSLCFKSDSVFVLHICVKQRWIWFRGVHKRFIGSPKYSVEMCIFQKSYFWEFQAETLCVYPKRCFSLKFSA